MMAIVASLREEVAPLLRMWPAESVDAPGEAMAYRLTPRLDGAEDVLLLLTGPSGQRADAAASWLVQDRPPEMVLSIGFAGATIDTLGPGDLVLATELFRLEGPPFDWHPDTVEAPVRPDARLLSVARDAAELAGVDFELGAMMSLPSIAKTEGLKRWLGWTFNVAAADLESYWVSRAASEKGIPFISARAIVDVVGLDLAGLVSMIDGRLVGSRPAPVVEQALKDPRKLPPLAQVARASMRARRSLAAFVQEFLRELRETAAADDARARRP